MTDISGKHLWNLWQLVMCRSLYQATTFIERTRRLPIDDEHILCWIGGKVVDLVLIQDKSICRIGQQRIQNWSCMHTS
jgi:hypothetical protein